MKTRTFLFTTILGAGLAFGVIPSSHAAPTNRDAVHSWPNKVVTNTFGNCVRTRWSSQDDECNNAPLMIQAQEARNMAIPDEDRTIYFGFNRSNIQESERHKLNSLTNTLKSMRDVSGVSVVGYADRIGSVADNERLSQKRAKAVEQSLRERGYLNTTVAKTRWLGESESVTQCNKNLKRAALISCLQRDRRVTLEIQYEGDAAKN